MKQVLKINHFTDNLYPCSPDWKSCIQLKTNKILHSLYYIILLITVL